MEQHPKYRKLTPDIQVSTTLNDIDQKRLQDAIKLQQATKNPKTIRQKLFIAINKPQ